MSDEGNHGLFLQELQPAKNLPVVKANKLIESSYKLSLQEQRIVLCLISKIRIVDRDFQWYKVRISKLAKFLGIDKNKNISKELRENIRALMRKIITIKGHEKDMDLHWIDAADYGVKGYVKISVHQKLKPYLLGLKSHFTRYCLKYVIDFKSSYSIRLYEILKRFEHNGEATLELETIKHMLGFEENEYTLYADLKKWVLLVAQREISEKTDISFTFEEIREWKKVLALHFIIKPNEKQDLASFVEFQSETNDSEEAQEPPELDFFEALPDDTPENIKEMLNKIPGKYRESKAILASLKKYLKEKGLDYVERNIVYANKKSNAVNPLANPGKEANYISYLNKSLQRDWGLPHQENQQVKEEDEKMVKEAREADERKKRAEAEARKCDEMLLDQAKAHYETLPAETQREIETAALAAMPEELRKNVDERKPFWKKNLDLAIKKIVLGRLTKEAINRETKG